MSYPIILGGDHAAFEAEWSASGRPDHERPDWPLPSFDAQDWAAAFCKIANEHGFKDAEDKPIDEDWMITWFANALMRGFDEAQARAALAQAVSREPDIVERLRSYARNCGGPPEDYLTWQAADEIEGLRAALDYVADMTYCGADAEWHFKLGYDPQTVLDALEPKP